VLVFDNFRTDRRSSRGIVNVFLFVSDTMSRHYNTSEVVKVHVGL